METQQLEFVLAAMKADSFAQAARKCYTSRQNISHAVKATEREFGVVLFKREDKKLVLTEDGKIFSAKAQRVLDTVREMHQIAAHNGSQTFEALNVAVSTALFSALPSGTAEMLLNWPGGVRFEEMDYEDCIGCASDESVDGALVISMNRDYPGCDSFHIATMPVYAWIGKKSPLAQRQTIALEELEGRRLLLVSKGDSQYRQMFLVLRNRGIHDVSYNVITGIELAHELVKHTDGIGVVSEVFAMNAPSDTVVIPFDGSFPAWQIQLLYQASAKTSRRVLALAHFAKERLDDKIQ